MSRYNLATKFACNNVDRQNGVIHGVSVATIGPARGHKCYLDATTLDQIMASAQTYDKGLKVKADHGSGVFSTLGYLKNFKRDGDRLRGDLVVLPSFEDKEKFYDMAEHIPDTFGLSVSFSGPNEKRRGKKFARCAEIYSADVVSEPAANPTGLFGNSRSMLDKITGKRMFSNDNHDSHTGQFSSSNGGNAGGAGSMGKTVADLHLQSYNKARDAGMSHADARNSAEDNVTGPMMGVKAKLAPEKGEENEKIYMAARAAGKSHVDAMREADQKTGSNITGHNNPADPRTIAAETASKKAKWDGKIADSEVADFQKTYGKAAKAGSPVSQSAAFGIYKNHRAQGMTHSKALKSTSEHISPPKKDMSILNYVRSLSAGNSAESTTRQLETGSKGSNMETPEKPGSESTAEPVLDVVQLAAVLTSINTRLEAIETRTNLEADDDSMDMGKPEKKFKKKPAASDDDDDDDDDEDQEMSGEDITKIACQLRKEVKQLRSQVTVLSLSRKGGAPAAAGQAVGDIKPKVPGTEEKKDFSKLVAEAVASGKTKGEAIQLCMTTNPNEYQEYRTTGSRSL